jgi:hypothetical protein
VSNDDGTARGMTSGASVEDDLEEMIRSDQGPEEWEEGDEHDVRLRALDDDASRTDSIGPLEDLDSEDVGEEADEDEGWRGEESWDDDRG